jgi:hypothetical protein
LWFLNCLTGNCHRNFLYLSSLVAGLPEPSPNHAEIITRFADEILKKLRVVTAELGTKLGPGTSSLQMRIGVSIKKNEAPHIFQCSHALFFYYRS